MVLWVTQSSLTSGYQQIERTICLSLDLRLMQLQILHKVWMSYAVNKVMIKGKRRVSELNQQPCHEHTWSGEVQHN